MPLGRAGPRRYRRLPRPARAGRERCSRPVLLSTESGRQIFVIGHPEYDKYTLDAEYKRDVKAGKPINVPCNYYPDDDPPATRCSAGAPTATCCTPTG